MLELEIRKEMNIRGKFFNLEGIPSRMNKEAKIKTALVGRYQQANIFHLKGGMYVNELEAQCLKFPNGKHDDVLDAFAMCSLLLDSYSPHYRGKPKMVVMDYSKYL
jgi:phage terminase large subunit-like protein